MRKVVVLKKFGIVQCFTPHFQPISAAASKGLCSSDTYRLTLKYVRDCQSRSVADHF